MFGPARLQKPAARRHSLSGTRLVTAITSQRLSIRITEVSMGRMEEQLTTSQRGNRSQLIHSRKCWSKCVYKSQSPWKTVGLPWLRGLALRGRRDFDVNAIEPTPP